MAFSIRKAFGLKTIDRASSEGDGDGTLDEGPVAVLKQKTKSNQSNDRVGQEDGPAGVDEDGGTLDEGPVAILKQKTKSNQSNDRVGQEDGPAGDGAGEHVVQYRESDMDFVAARDRAPEGGGIGEPAMTSNLNLSKSNINRVAEGGVAAADDGEAPAGLAVNLNSSKSNTYRATDDAGAGGEPAMAANLNLSKSNINRVAEGDGGTGAEPSLETTVKSSKSNSSEQIAGGGDDGSPEAAINNTKSNIKNVTAGGDSDADGDAGAGLSIDEPGVHREAGTADDGAPGAAINTSHSNIKNMAATGPEGGGEGDAPQAMATNLNTSRSNVYRSGDEGAGADDPGDPAAMEKGTVKFFNDKKGMVDDGAGAEQRGPVRLDPTPARAAGADGGAADVAGAEASGDAPDPSDARYHEWRWNSARAGAEPGEGAGDGAAGLTIERQTPKQDFGDRVSTKEPSKIEYPNRTAGGADGGVAVWDPDSDADGIAIDEAGAHRAAAVPGAGGEDERINNTKSNIGSRTDEPETEDAGAFAIKEQGVRREASSGMATGKAAGEKDHGSQVAADDGSAERTAGHEAAHTIQQGSGGPPTTAREAGSGMATGKAMGEKDKGSEQSATGEDDWQAPTAREAGSGMATGKAAEAKDHGSQREGIGEEPDAEGLNGLPPGEATERNKLWNASNFRRDAVDEDDDGPSTLLDLSGTADGEGAVADLDLDGMPDVSGLDLDGDADADGVDLESLALDS